MHIMFEFKGAENFLGLPFRWYENKKVHSSINRIRKCTSAAALWKIHVGIQFCWFLRILFGTYKTIFAIFLVWGYAEGVKDNTF